MELDVEVRGALESMVDSWLENPKLTYDSMKNRLAQLGIDPNLETVLSMTSGFILGYLSAIGALKGIEESDQIQEFHEACVVILERRAWEIRQAILNAQNL